MAMMTVPMARMRSIVPVPQIISPAPTASVLCPDGSVMVGMIAQMVPMRVMRLVLRFIVMPMLTSKSILYLLYVIFSILGTSVLSLVLMICFFQYSENSNYF